MALGVRSEDRIGSLLSWKEVIVSFLFEVLSKEWLQPQVLGLKS